MAMRSRIVFQGAGEACRVEVADEEGLRVLRFGGGERQSCLDMRYPHRLQLAYTQWMATALLLHPDPKRFLVLGLGGGALPHFLLHHHPDALVDVVEKEAIILQVARDFFSLPHSPRLRTFHQDALSYVRDTTEGGYQVAFLDIFGEDGMAPDLYEERLYAEVLARLSADGILVVNVWNGDRQLYRKAVEAAGAASDGRLLCLPVHKRGNELFFLFAGPIPKSGIRQAIRQSNVFFERYGIDFAPMLKRLRRSTQAWPWQRLLLWER
ncbi:MAG: hypothetical protein ACOX5Z_07685 [Desulfobulbus sp.]